MTWAAGGVLLWLGGWWFTGRLVGVYQKAIYLEAAERRHRGTVSTTAEHHRGIFLFAVFDLGLLVLGIRSITTLLYDENVPAEDYVGWTFTKWSALFSIYVVRQGINFHGLYHALMRARTGKAAMERRSVGTLRGVWAETPVALRAVMVAAPLMACVPLVIDNPPVQPVWLYLPQAGLLLALAIPLLGLRQRARSGGA